MLIMNVLNLHDDETDKDSIALGYSASMLGINQFNQRKTSSLKLRTSLFDESCSSKLREFSSSSKLSNVVSAKTPIVLEKWYLQPMLGCQAIKVCGTKSCDGKFHKSSAIQTRVNSRCALSIKGTMYRILGPIQHATNTPVWFEEKFVDGFPLLWKTHVSNYLEWLSQQSSGNDSDDNVLSNSKDTSRINDDQVKLTLYRWVLHFSGKHLRVEGFAVTPDGKFQLYRTSHVVDVVNQTLLYTTTRSYYRLSGPLNIEATVQGGIPVWFAKKFTSGFPSNWRDMIDVYLNYISVNNNDKKDNSDSVEMMSLLSCEGFALGNQQQNLNSNEIKLGSAVVSNKSFNCDIPFDVDTFDDVNTSTYVSDSASRLKVKRSKIKKQKKIVKKDIVVEESLKKSNETKKSLSQKKVGASVKDTLLSLPTNNGFNPSDQDSSSESKVERPKMKKTNKSVQKNPQLHKSVKESSKSEKKFLRETIKRTPIYRDRSPNCREKACIQSTTKSSKKKNRKLSDFQSLETEEVGLEKLNMPKFCLPQPGNSLYKTKSGRHVFPPLEHWTHQRLTTEHDADGKEVIVFHPGNSSVLANSSPVCNYLRNSESFQKQIIQDELMLSPSTRTPKVLKVRQKKRKKSHCVKNILDSSDDQVKNQNAESSPQDFLSRSVCYQEKDELINEIKQSPGIKDDSIIPDDNVLDHSNAQLPDKDQDGLKASVETQAQLVLTEDIPKNKDNVNSSKGNLRKRKVTRDASLVPVKKSLRISNRKKMASTVGKNCSSCNTNIVADQNTNTATLICKEPNSTTLHKNTKSKTPLKDVANKPNKAEINNDTPAQLPLADKLETVKCRYNLRKRKSVQASLKKSASTKAKSRSTPSPDCAVANFNGISLKKELKVLCCNDTTLIAKLNQARKLETKSQDQIKTVKQMSKLQNKENIANYHQIAVTTKPAKFTSQSDKKACASKKQFQKKKIVSKNVEKSAGIPKKTRKRKTKKNQITETTSNNLVARKDTGNLSEGKSLIITARHGSLKQRGQKKDALEVLNKNVDEQDFFTSVPNSNLRISEDCFQVDRLKTSTGPYTPLGKLSENFQQHVQTPAWFKTPSTVNGFSLASEETPSDVKGTSFFQTCQVADRCIVQLQKKSRKAAEVAASPKRRSPKKKHPIIPHTLFHVEVEEAPPSSDEDDYFSS